MMFFLCDGCCLLTTVPIGILGILFYYLYDSYKSNKRLISLKNQRVVITGGSSGIGLSLAKLTYHYGAHVTIIARNVENLKEAEKDITKENSIASGTIDYLSLDITSNYQSLENGLRDLIGNTDILINCAGSAISRTFIETTPADIENQMRLNYLGSAQVTRVLLPMMLEQGPGHRVVFVSSMAGQVATYGFAAYSASKFALRGLAESLLMEVDQHGVSVTLAFPPDTRTPGFDREQVGKPAITSKISAMSGLSEPDAVARSIILSALAGRFFCSVGFDGALLTWLTYGMCLPQSLGDIGALLVLGPVWRLVAIFYGLWMRSIVRRNSN